MGAINDSLTAMRSRLAGRLVTGSVAFLVAWVLDVLVLLARWLVQRRRSA
jgi:hypothetical protein